ncbi:hypothetical protein GCM10010277_38190 [Streptomyces longisporoflavus]|nr:hypothetical protein GCM10010277_38190 [Streptomyces longisporoflavus]
MLGIAVGASPSDRDQIELSADLLGGGEALLSGRRDVRVLFEEGTGVLDGVADGAAADTG